MSSAKAVLIPLPSYGFDPTESAVPWRVLTRAGHQVTFATPEGEQAAADSRMVTGRDLPVLLRKTLMARPNDVRAYREMEASDAFRRPLAYEKVEPDEFDAVLLPGGHDKGMRPYLESGVLHEKVAHFFDHGKPVGAICHGTLLAARSISQEDPACKGRSVLWGRRTTGLTRNQEMISFWLTRMKLGDYYRTYDMPMMDDLISHLRAPTDYTPGPGRPIPMGRDSEKDLSAGFTVRDGNYLSARWPGDAHSFARAFVQMLEEPPREQPN
jgi:putative intracellular protease/amidase